MPDIADINFALAAANASLASYVDAVFKAAQLLAMKAMADNPGWKVEPALGDHDRGPDSIRLVVSNAHCWAEVYEYEMSLHRLFFTTDKKVDSWFVGLSMAVEEVKHEDCELHGRRDEVSV